MKLIKGQGNKAAHILFPIGLALLAWIFYMTTQDLWVLFRDYWFISLTMVAGSFIAGASSEGGGAVAFPVMTLIFNIEPVVARNFSLAIQSIGMTAASFVILKKKFPIEVRYLYPVSIGGMLGIVLGTLLLVPLIPAAYAKMLFVAIWLSFGIVLFYINKIYRRRVIDRLPRLSGQEQLQLGLVGVIGGGLSAILGSGIDIFSFSYVTMRYHLNEKVATPTSVIAMAINAVVGFLFHILFLRDFSNEAFNYWMVSIPVVLIGAPMGAYFINQKTRTFVAGLLYVIILLQFTGAVMIIRPTGKLLIVTVAALLFGLLFFFGFSRLFLSGRNDDTHKAQ
jgi:uncharacterized membrane protein YfcA